jgi:hypothetical protein
MQPEVRRIAPHWPFWQRHMDLLLGKPHLAKLPVKEVEKILVARHRSSPIVHGGG